MKDLSKKFLRMIVSGIKILLVCTMVLSIISCETEEKEETVKDRLGQASGLPSIGVGRLQDILTSVISSNPQLSGSADSNDITICIDPGHGFDDAGASSDLITEYDEKDLTLLYANLLKEKLSGLGYTVLMTHDGENLPITTADDGNNKFNPYERAAFVNAHEIDYFVSLHCDSYSDGTIGGTRIYFCETENKIADYSEDIANSIRKQLSIGLPEEKEASVHNMQPSEAYAVLRETFTAASLIEIGFITNNEDVQKILDTEWRERFIVAVANGIDSYFTSIE